MRATAKWNAERRRLGRTAGRGDVQRVPSDRGWAAVDSGPVPAGIEGGLRKIGKDVIKDVNISL